MKTSIKTYSSVLKILLSIPFVFSLSLGLAQSPQLWGLTSQGGLYNEGTIFKIDTNGTNHQVIHSFDGTDGRDPQGSLIQASNGKLYGMSPYGGSNGGGVIFKLDPVSGNYNVLWDFTSTTGRNPYGSLLETADSTFYGMTSSGGAHGYGVIFQFNPYTQVYTTKFDFNIFSGSYPSGSFIQAANGNLYGTTTIGGAHNYGVIFQFEPDSSIYQKLFDFGYSNGSEPQNDLLEVKKDLLYGTTRYGGANSFGVLFELNITSQTYTVKYENTYNNGYYPDNGLTLLKDSIIQGMNTYGGQGWGTIFNYDYRSNNYTKQYDLPGGQNGQHPFGNLTEGPKGLLYGMTYYGGSYNYGTIFRFDRATLNYQKLSEFDFSNGSSPRGNLIFVKPASPCAKDTSFSSTICQGDSVFGHFQTGTYIDSLQSFGCTSLRTLHLTVSQVFDTLTTTICQGDSLFGYTQSGVYKDDFGGGANGCDSIRLLYLTVIPTKYDTLDINVPLSYLSPAGNLLYQSGTYSETLTSLSGCDSVLTINLSIDPSTLGPDTACERTFNLVWKKPHSHPSNQLINSRTTFDDKGNIYKSGLANSSVDLDPGPDSAFFSPSGGVVGIARYDSTGNFINTFQFGEPRGWEGGIISVTDITVDKFSSIYATGWYDGIIDFNPSSAVDSLDIQNSPAPRWDAIFVVKYDELGRLQWVNELGFIFYNYPRDIEVDDLGNTYVTGYIDTEHIIYQDGFLAKFNNLGGLSWIKYIPGDNGTLDGGFNEGKDIAIDKRGNAYVVANYTKSLKFYGTSVPELCCGGEVLLKYDKNGNIQWAKEIGASEVEIDEHGNVVLRSPTSLTCLDSNGTQMWSVNIPVADYAIDEEGYLFTTGQKTRKFDPSGYLLSTKDVYGSRIWLDSRGDVFVSGNDSIYKFSKYSNSKISVSACTEYLSPSGKYTWNTSGTYRDTLTNPTGCDSVITVELNLQQSFDTTQVTTCSPYISPSGLYTWSSSGSYMDTIPNSHGCDSILTVQLTIDPFQVSATLLVEEGTGLTIDTLTDGYVINKATLGGFSIEAITCNQIVGSVGFNLNGNITFENMAPYALVGDNPKGNINDWNPDTGSYYLIVTPYSKSNGNGTIGISDTVSFTVVDDLLDCHGDLGGTASPDACGVCSGGNTGLMPNASCTDCNGDINGSASIDSCGTCSGGSTGLAPNSCIDCNGDFNGTAMVDECGICAGGNTGMAPNSAKDTCGVCFGNNTSCAPPLCTVPEVTALVLINTTDISLVDTLSNAYVIDKAVLDSFSIRAEVCDTSIIGSVRFLVNGNPIITESIYEYTIQGNDSTGYYPWLVGPGNYTITATPYSGYNGSGATGISKTLSIVVIDSRPQDCHGDPAGSAFVDSCGVCSGGNTGAVPNASCTDCFGEVNGNAFLDDCDICAGGNTGLVANAAKDSCGVCFGNNTSCATCSSPLEISALTLVEVATSNDLAILTNGYTINKTAVGAFSIRADVCDPNAVGSVRFFINGNLLQNENTAPYAIKGDNASGYKPWNPAIGTYTLIATPYSSGNGNGNTGVSQTVVLNIVDGTSTPDCNGDLGGTAYLNDCNQCVGGNTGLPSDYGKDDCDICFGNNANKDCAGVCFGTAAIDGCGDCTGGTTGFPVNGGCIIDCNGDINGTATLDDCSICTGGNTGLTPNVDKDTCGVCFGNNISCAPQNCPVPEVTELTLINTKNISIVDRLINGYTIDLAVLDSFSIRAEVCDTSNVRSVQFLSNGNLISTENIYEYTIQGNDTTGYYPWIVGPGNYTLTVTPYSGYNGSGNAGISKTISIVVIDSRPTDCNGDTYGSAFIDDCGVCAGGNTGLAPNADKDSCGVCFGNNTSCGSCLPLEIVSLTLMHSGTSGPLRMLNPADTIIKSQVGSFSIRADVCSEPDVKSVRFFLNGSQIKNENAAPYSIAGDVGSNSYHSWNIAVGHYLLTATPYSRNNGNGTPGTSATVDLWILNSAPAASMANNGSGDPTEKPANERTAEDGTGNTQSGTATASETDFSLTVEGLALRLFPNPTSGKLTVETENAAADSELMLLDMSGKLLRTVSQAKVSGAHRTYSLDLSDLPKGIYLVKLRSGSEIRTKRVVRE